MTVAGNETLRPATTYLDRIAQGRLSFQSCTDCERAIFYPRVCCPGCGGTRLQWRDSTGKGTIYSLSTIPQRDQAVNVVCLVDLEEGFRMLSALVGEGAAEATIGDTVTVTFDHPDGEPRAVFTTGNTNAH